jgi:hypothetical protein
MCDGANAVPLDSHNVTPTRRIIIDSPIGVTAQTPSSSALNRCAAR